MKVKPKTVEDCILMYSAQSIHGDGDFAALSINNGYVQFQYDLGTGQALIRSKQKIQTGEWHQVI
jgi:hypothetical protein